MCNCGYMVKTADDCKGYVSDDGDVVKINTIQDIRYMAEGCATAGFILEKAGVDPATIGSTVYRGAHPGGTAPIGKIVHDAFVVLVVSRGKQIP